MYKSIVTLAAASAAFAGTIVAMPAEARARGHMLSVQGSGGHGFVQSRSVSRQPGSISATRGFQADNGRGYSSTRNANWGDGSYSGGRTTTLNNGKSFGRSTTATANGEGSADFTTTRTGLDGHTSSVSGTIDRQP